MRTLSQVYVAIVALIGCWMMYLVTLGDSSALSAREQMFILYIINICATREKRDRDKKRKRVAVKYRDARAIVGNI